MREQMRKFFSFKSSGSGSANGQGVALPPAPPLSDDSVCLEKVGRRRSNFSVGRDQNSTQSSKNATLIPLNQHPENEDSSRLLHRRSHSFSSSTVNRISREGNAISWSDLSRSTFSARNSPQNPANRPRECLAMTPEKCLRTKSGDLFPSQHSQVVEELGFPSSSRDYETSPVNSPYSSPLMLRCNSSRLSWFPKGNDLIDRYIDGEDQEVSPEINYEICSSETRTDCCLAENRAHPTAGAQQFHCTVLPSTHGKENIRTHLPGEENDIFHSAQNFTKDDHRVVTSKKHAKKSVTKPSHAFPGKSTVNLRGCDSESSTTFEDIYMDSVESQLALHSDDTQQLTDCNPSNKKQTGYFTQAILGLDRCDCSIENESLGIRNDKMMCFEQQLTDEELLKKLKDVEKMIDLLPEDEFYLKELQRSNVDVSALFQIIRNTKAERKSFLLGLFEQLKCRLADRYAAKEHIRQARIAMNTRTRRLEREKNQVQFSLEKELDRRSSDWSMKFEKLQLEEQRLRERVRELAEQNVSLQREVSSLKDIQGESQIRIVNSELELTNVTARLERMRTENFKMQDDLNVTKEDQNCIKICFHEKERENKALQNIVVRLQRTCTEQEMTIKGLKQGYNDIIGNKSTIGSDELSKLQMEQLRLTDIEQNLRKELETCKHEVETLRHENVGLLSRLQVAGNGCGFSSIKLDQELHARVDCLQTQGLSLLNDMTHFICDMLKFLKHKPSEHAQDAEKDTNGYLYVDCSMKSQSLCRRSEIFRRSIQTIVKILDEKSDSQAVGSQSLPVEGSTLKQPEDELEIQLKSEIILTKLLKEKLCSNELELERLQADLASSIRVHDVLQTEIQRMQDELSYLTHKTTDMELQILRKGETIKQLENKHQECKKELTAARNILSKVTEERDRMWEEVKSSKEKNLLSNYEVLSLKKKIEELDEDILTKEGQITILRESLEKPFSLISSPLDQ